MSPVVAPDFATAKEDPWWEKLETGSVNVQDSSGVASRASVDCIQNKKNRVDIYSGIVWIAIVE